MVRRPILWAAAAILGLSGPGAIAGNIYQITYTDLTLGTTTDLTAAGALDWVKWGNGEPSGTTAFSAPEKTGGTIINPALTALGSVPSGQTVVLTTFAPPPTILDFTWTDGTPAMAGGGPVATVVSETINPAQFSYPLGLGASFTAAAAATPLQLDVYVQGFNARMLLGVSLSGGGTASLLASNAALVLVPAANNNYFSAGYFSIIYAGAGETLTVNLTAADQVGVPTAPQRQFPNAGFFAATVNEAQVIPEPASLVLSALGLIVVAGGRRLARRAPARVR